jgi:hypothetical protein
MLQALEIIPLDVIAEAAAVPVREVKRVIEVIDFKNENNVDLNNRLNAPTGRSKKRRVEVIDLT